MMNQHQFEEKLYYNLSLTRLIPEDHLLRQIAEAVDFSFIRPLCRPFYSHTGRPSVDPVVLFKMLLIGYLYWYPSNSYTLLLKHVSWLLRSRQLHNSTNGSRAVLAVGLRPTLS